MTHLLEPLLGKPPLQIMSAHSPLAAILAEEAGFDGVWASGFELSALYGLADVSLTTMSEHLDMTRRIASTCELPVVADIDTGFGNAVNVAYSVRKYEEAGAAAVVMEDKTFPKVTSLIEGGRQDLLRVDEFQGKIEAAVATRKYITVIARVEALIAGLGQQEAQVRAKAYADAGADMILIHSKQKKPDEILSFIHNWDGSVPLVLVPTSYPQLSVADIAATGKVGLIIWGNHAIRAAVQAMQETFARILKDGGIASSEDSIASVKEVFRLQNMDGVKALEIKYLR